MDFALHADKYLGPLIQQYGAWVYLLLFGIVFCETGFVVTPFFPGDSLLFAAGAFAALGALDVWALFFVLTAAAILGDTANYWIGRYSGKKLFKKESRFFKKEYLSRAEEFYEKHGAKTIVLARFVPIIRTFAPFVAGLGEMKYARFLAYNIVGGVAWVALFVFGGYFFGGLQAVQENFSLAIIAIIALSFLPILAELLRRKTRGKQAKRNA